MNPQTAPKKNRAVIVVGLFLIVAAAGAALIFSLTQWNVPAVAKKMRNPAPTTESNIDEGMAQYQMHCKSCHGDDGNGKGDRVGELSIMPTDFTDAALMGRVTDGELFWKITHGRRPMPAFEDKLTDTERWQVVDYIRTFAQPQQPASAPK